MTMMMASPQRPVERTAHEALASTCKAASAGFWRCTTRRQTCWRGCRASASGSPRFAPTAGESIEFSIA